MGPSAQWARPCRPASEPPDPSQERPYRSFATDTALSRRLEERLGDQLVGPVRARQDTTEIVIAPGSVTSVMTALHDDDAFRFLILSDLCGVDTGSTMQVVYHLWSETTPDWLRVIADGLPRDDPRIASVTFLWNGAEWAEREAYDMFGIIFEGNRDLRRIYMPPDYQSFPLRKDFLLPDDAARSPGMGVRHIEQTFQPGETRRQPVLRQGTGTAAATVVGGSQTAELASGEDPAAPAAPAAPAERRP
ncbi:MAG TPA: NADH-quinone oxidoreductase subunit C [Candidatus Limnocylindrales bacterium]|nr:NADH-quinone oxidoreductase subunit C [Candidatus Limnocylindrales bacterium]